MTRITRTLAALLLGASLASAQTIRVGEKLPPTVLENLTQTEARSFSEFYGRTVLLEFFAYWCGPCAASVPHVNELQEKFASRGFSVIGVTAEAPAKTEPWIKKTKAAYAYGYDTTNALHKGFGINSIPFAALIDPDGTVLWTGHPQRLTEERIEKALAGALERPVWTWPDQARALAPLLDKGQYATVLEKAQGLGVQDGFDLQAVVRGRIGSMVARFEEHLQKKDYSEAVGLGTRLERELAGLPEGQALAERMKTLRADADVMHEVEAAAKLSDLEGRAAEVRKPSEAKKLREEVAAFLEKEKGRRFERRGQNLLEALDRALSKVGKDP